MPIYLPAPEVNCSKGLPKLSIYKIPMGSDSEASITIKNINEQFKEKHILNKNLKGIVYESAITLGQYATLLDKLHVKDMDNIFIYDIKEKNNFINEGKVGILLNSDNEVNIIDIPVSINDPLQMKIIEEQIASIITQENIKENQYENEQFEQENDDLEI